MENCLHFHNNRDVRNFNYNVKRRNDFTYLSISFIIRKIIVA